MTISQISIFLENKSGRLFEVTKTLLENGINISALSLADTIDFGILRLIVSDPDKAEKALKDAGFTVMKNNVLAVYIENKPGGLHNVLTALEGANISVEYTYAFVDQVNVEAMVVLCLDDLEKGLKVFEENGIRIVEKGVIYNL